MEQYKLPNEDFLPVGNHGIYEYFLRNTDRFGDYCVFQHRGKDHSRSELISDIEALACYFRSVGLLAGDVYTVFAPTSMESMAIFLALNKLGVIVNFIPPFFPSGALREIMRFTGSKGIAVFDSVDPDCLKPVGERNIPLMLCSMETYAADDKSDVTYAPQTVAALEANRITYAKYGDALRRYAGRTTESLTGNGKSVAVYMYGGGTTGQSRTIQLSNFAINIVTYMCCCTNGRPAHPGVDTEIGCMPFFHAFGLIASGLEPMVKAAKIILLSHFDSDEFIGLMKRNRVVQFSGVPNLFRKLYDNPAWDGPHLADMQICFGGGDDVGPGFMRHFNDTFAKNGSPALLHQGYGLTECCAIVLKNLRGQNREGSVGKPLPLFRVEIWDEDHKPMPVGAIGEIVVSGPALMEGYLTKDGRMGDGLYTDEEGTRWVLSGDYGHRDADGYFYFDGRKKNIVVISGYNVYPADITHVLTELPFVKESCPVQGFDENGRVLVRLYVSLQDSATEDQEVYRRLITEECAKMLPKYSVPRDIRFLRALPRTRVQKIDFMRLTQQTPDDPIYTDAQSR